MSEVVKYCNRLVAKDGFRAWVYNKDSKKLAGSWDDYMTLVGSGLWFSSKDEIPAEVAEVIVQDEQPKKTKNQKMKRKASNENVLKMQGKP